MSYDLLRRLWWDGSAGLVNCDGVPRKLSKPPIIDGEVVAEVDYMPDLGVCLIRRKFMAQRDMTKDERESAAALLRAECS